MPEANVKPDSVELRSLSTFKYEVTLLDSKIRIAETDSDKLLYSTVRDYLQSRIDNIQNRI